MKQIIAGFIVGILLMDSLSALAEDRDGFRGR
jgi:hypothetical protein